jgi:hypothetical protein
VRCAAREMVKFSLLPFSSASKVFLPSRVVSKGKGAGCRGRERRCMLRIVRVQVVSYPNLKDIDMRADRNRFLGIPSCDLTASLPEADVVIVGAAERPRVSQAGPAMPQPRRRPFATLCVVTRAI